MTDPVARDRPRTEASDATEPTWPEDPHAMQDGPSVHHFGWRSKGEWDIPFGSWTLLRATDADGREHIFHVPTAALPSSAPHPDRLERALNRLPDRHSATIHEFAAALAAEVEGLPVLRVGGDVLLGDPWLVVDPGPAPLLQSPPAHPAGEPQEVATP